MYTPLPEGRGAKLSRLLPTDVIDVDGALYELGAVLSDVAGESVETHLDDDAGVDPPPLEPEQGLGASSSADMTSV